MKQFFKRAGRVGTASMLILTALTITLVRPTTTLAFDPAPWTSLLLPAPVGYSPTTSTVCTDGSISCVDNVIASLQTQLNPLVATCDHKLMFNFLYLKITEAYKNAALTPGYFQNTPYVNQEDAVFASYYQNQFNAWQNGQHNNVSPAWQIAFQAADQKQTTSLGDLLLAINAHIAGDEPFVLDEMGLVYPDGSSAKLDYNKDNDWLSAAQTSAITEAARKYDANLNNPQLINQPPFDTLTYQFVAGLREQAWRDAEGLKLAEQTHNPLLYNTIKAEIATRTVATANAILLATHSTPQQNADRDTYCMAHRFDP